MTAIYRTYWKREWCHACRSPFDFIHGLWFCLIVVTLFPIALSASAQTLKSIAPAVIWVAAILSNLLSLERIFRDDKDSGTLEQIWLGGQGLVTWLCIKLTVHWTFSCLPLVMLSPLIGYVLGLPPDVLLTVLLSLLFGTPTLMILGAIVSALTLNLKKSGLLLGLLVLPLTVPIFIFGLAAIEFADYGFSSIAQLMLLFGLMLAAWALGPLVVAYSLRLAIMH